MYIERNIEKMALIFFGFNRWVGGGDRYEQGMKIEDMQGGGGKSIELRPRIGHCYI
jgi:hypothetical protein